MTFPNATLGCLQCHTLFSEMPYFIVPDATLQQLKCHTPLSETYGIPDDEVWHPGR